MLPGCKGGLIGWRIAVPRRNCANSSRFSAPRARTPACLVPVSPHLTKVALGALPSPHRLRSAPLRRQRAGSTHVPGQHGTVLRFRANAQAPLRISPVSSRIGQNLTHQARTNAKELSSVFPVHVPAVDQPRVGLVDERRGLERVATRLARHVAMRHAMQLLVDIRS
jgi:hypothetical protein